MKNIIATALLSLSLSFAGCKPTVEGESARYTQTKDRLEALATKNPAMKADIAAKIAEFETAKKDADAKTGEEKAKALRELNNRIAAYEATLTPAATPDGPVLGSKLGDAGAGSAAPVVDAPGGKLGGGSGSAPAGSGSGSGSGSAKSGFGAPPPDAAPPAGSGSSKSGFGGK